MTPTDCPECPHRFHEPGPCYDRACGCGDRDVEYPSIKFDPMKPNGLEPPVTAPDPLREAAQALFGPMPHGSPSKPNEGHTVETLCAACVSVRSKRYSAIRRALVESGDLPSISMRGGCDPDDDGMNPVWCVRHDRLLSECRKARVRGGPA